VAIGCAASVMHISIDRQSSGRDSVVQTDQTVNESSDVCVETQAMSLCVHCRTRGMVLVIARLRAPLALGLPPVRRLRGEGRANSREDRSPPDT
jgi:lactam utilization protein B